MEGQVSTMYDLTFSNGTSRKDTHWLILTCPWGDIQHCCSRPKVKPISMVDFLELKEEEAASHKDHDGMVFGKLKDGIRNESSVVYKSVVCLDLDHAKQDTLDKLLCAYPWKILCYSTFHHTPEKPRLWVILPSSADIPPEKIGPVARKMDETLGVINLVDPVSYNPARLMYWLVKIKDGEFIYKEKTGPYKDPD